MVNFLTMSLQASVLILVIMLLRRLFIHKLPKKTFLVLWAVVLCCLLLPVSIPSRFSVWNIADNFISLQQITASNTIDPQPKITDNLPNSAGVDATAVTDFTVPTVEILAYGSSFITKDETADGNNTAVPRAVFRFLFWLWLGGVAICLFFFLLPHLRLQKIYKKASPVDNVFVKFWLSKHPMFRSISINQSDELDIPLTYGIFRPVILLPCNINWEDKAGLSYILAHEYFHIRHMDVLWKWVLAITLCLHWFNPLVWLMYKLANRDIEHVCDEATLLGNKKNTMAAYAKTLIELEEKRSGWMSLSAAFSRNAIEERIVAIMKRRKTTFLSVFAAIFLVCSTSLVFATSQIITPFINIIQVNNPPLWSETSPFVQRLLFVRQGETGIRVSTNGQTWEPFEIIIENEQWRWFSYEEFDERVRLISTGNFDESRSSVHSVRDPTKRLYLGAERNIRNLIQTRTDIRNGIRVSRPKTIFLTSGEGLSDNIEGWMQWYVYAFTFQDRNGNIVDLGLHETRDSLFAALRQYYDNEIAAGRISRREANRLFNNIAHGERNVDEAPLMERLLNGDWQTF